MAWRIIDSNSEINILFTHTVDQTTEVSHFFVAYKIECKVYIENLINQKCLLYWIGTKHLAMIKIFPIKTKGKTKLLMQQYNTV